MNKGIAGPKFAYIGCFTTEKRKARGTGARFDFRPPPDYNSAYTFNTHRNIMRTNIVLDDRLVARAMKLAGAKTKREAVHVALREFVRSRSRPDVREIYGIGGLDPAYDHKKLRAGG